MAIICEQQQQPGIQTLFQYFILKDNFCICIYLLNIGPELIKPMANIQKVCMYKFRNTALNDA